MKHFLARIFLCSLGCHAKGCIVKIYQAREFYLCPRCGKIRFEVMMKSTSGGRADEIAWNAYTDAYWNGVKWKE